MSVKRLLSMAGLVAVIAFTGGCATNQPSDLPLPPVAPSTSVTPAPEASDFWADLTFDISAPQSGRLILDDAPAGEDAEDTSVPEGRNYSWTLQCADDRVAGTHPTPQAACDFIDGIGADFFVQPVYEACTMQYGGPETMVIHGTYRGEEVSRSFARTNGCELGEWAEELAPGVILPPPGVVID